MATAPPADLLGVSIELPEASPTLEVRKVCVVWNPFSGKGKGRKAHAFVVPKLQQAGIAVTSFQTARAKHAQDLVAREIEDFDEYDVVCVVGGDGTLNEVVNGLALRTQALSDGAGAQELPCCKPIALIPGGTGNSFAMDLGFTGRKAVQTALQALLGGRLRSCDAALVKMSAPQEGPSDAPVKEEARYMVNLVGLGIGVDANLRAEWWRCCGPIRYDWSILLEILAIDVNKGDSQTVTVYSEPAAEGGQAVGESTTFEKGVGIVMIQNTVHGGAGLKLAPNALIDDGYMDLIMADKLGSLATLGLFNKVKAGGKHVHDPRVTEKKFTRLTFTSETEKWVNIDGENCGKTPIDVTVKPRMFQVFAL